MQLPEPVRGTGVSLAAPETRLTERALDYLAAGPADASTLIAHVCQLPGTPTAVAEHIALTLFAGHRRVARGADGLWRLADAVAFLPPPEAAGDALAALAYAVVDVETTGTSADHGDRVTEVAVRLVANGAVTTAFETLINPQRPIPRYITQLTQISWEMVKDAPTFADVCDQLLGALDGRVFVAHNATFDWNFLSAEVRRVTGRALEGRRLCTVRLARKLLPQLRRRSLDYVAAHYGIDIGARHRAGGDAEATAHVLLRLLRDARGLHGCECWGDLERLLAGSPSGRRSRRPPAMPHAVSKDTTA